MHGLLRRARRRIRIVWGAATLSVATPIAGALVLVGAVVAWLAGATIPVWAPAAAIGVVAIGVAAVARALRISDHDAARIVERRAELDDVLTTALEVEASDDLYRRMIDERAQAAAAAVSIPSVLPVRLGGRRIAAGLALAAAATLVTLVDPLGGTSATAEAIAEVEAEAALLEELAEELAEAKEAAEEEEDAALAAELAELEDLVAELAGERPRCGVGRGGRTGAGPRGQRPRRPRGGRPPGGEGSGHRSGAEPGPAAHRPDRRLVRCSESARGVGGDARHAVIGTGGRSGRPARCPGRDPTRRQPIRGRRALRGCECAADG